MAPFGVIKLCQLVQTDNVNPMTWIEWLAVACIGIPAAVLTTAMHTLHAWRPVPLVSDTTAPLVDSDQQQPVLDAPPQRPPGGDLLSSGGRPGASDKRPVWPPPDAPGVFTGDDLRSTARVAGALHSGDARGVSARDVASTARVAAAVWPPPQ